MEKGRARQFQPATTAPEQSWNVVELMIRKQIRQKLHDLLRLCDDNSVTTSDIRQELLQGLATFGTQFATQLVRSLHRDDEAERQSITWLLTVLHSPETIPPLQHMAASKRLPRAVRLAASLALAGMVVTAEMIEKNRRAYLYALS
jgi:hypothetical protein